MDARALCRIIGFVCSLAEVASAALPARPASTDPDEARILEKRTIDIPVEGCVTGTFERAFAVLGETNLLDSVQSAYAAQLPAGQQPEFVVHSTAPGLYFYVNKNSERCDIRELWRRTDSNRWFQVAFHVRGERSFGPFESLVYLTVAREDAAPPRELHYVAEVRAWPQPFWVRFLAQHLPGIECYFRMKTAEMRGIITRVFARMVAA